MPSNLADEIVYGRDHDHARVFISSKMDGTLTSERARTAEAIDRTDMYRAWWWEQDAAVGVLHSEAECIKYAGSSDGLILLIAGDLSQIIYAEYNAARAAKANTFIFIRDDGSLPDAVRQFINEQRKTVVTRNFQNEAELETHVYQSLIRAAVRAIRLGQVGRLGS